MERLKFPSPEFWEGKRVLLTGHSGFKGAWLALWLARMKAKVHGYALPPDTDPAFYDLISVGSAIESRFSDLSDFKSLVETAAQCAPEIVIHMAAQSLVLRGYADPEKTFVTNVTGTIHLLESLRKSQHPPRVILVVTSDKVYNNDGVSERFSEDDPLGGADPYSASKAAVEIVVAAYRKSFFSDKGISLITARAGNVIGGGDFSQDRIVPDTWRAGCTDQPVTLRIPNATRPWQHVLDCLRGYLLYIEAACERDVPPALNFGPEKEGISVATVVSTMQQLMQLKTKGYVADQKETGMEKKYLMLDSSLARTTLGWRPCLENGTKWGYTADWYGALNSGKDMRMITLEQIAKYLKTTT